MTTALRMTILGAIALAAIGCGKDDPNKNLKPIDPNAKPPKLASESGGGGAAPAEKPASVVK